MQRLLLDQLEGTEPRQLERLDLELVGGRDAIVEDRERAVEPLARHHLLHQELAVFVEGRVGLGRNLAERHAMNHRKAPKSGVSSFILRA